MMTLLISVAGGTGALARFITDGMIRRRLGRTYPWGTVIVNISGSLLLGVCTGLLLSHSIDETFFLILSIGFCGGYTTFSAASFETVRLIENKRFGAAFFNAIIVLLVAVMATGAILFLLQK